MLTLNTEGVYLDSDFSYSVYENSYFVAEIKDNNISLHGQITTCRDDFLFKTFLHFYENGSPLTCALVISPSITPETIKIKLHYVKQLWSTMIWGTEPYFPKDSIDTVMFPDKVTRPVLIFTVTSNHYMNPLCFWLLTQDIRYTITEFSKINVKDAAHNSPEYYQLTKLLRYLQTYDKKIFPVGKKYSEDSYNHVSSPLAYLQTINTINNDMLLLYSETHTYIETEKIRICCDLLDRCNNILALSNLVYVFPIYNTNISYSYRPTIYKVLQKYISDLEKMIKKVPPKTTVTVTTRT